MRALLSRALTATRLKSLQAAFSDSYSQNTHKAYGRAVDRFAAFLKGRAADDDAVAAFLTAEAERGLAPASLAIQAAAIGAAASSAGMKDPRGPRTRRTLRRLKRKHAARGRGQVEGLRREDAVAAARLAAEAGTAQGLRDAALLRLGSDGLLRISELAGVQVDDLRLGRRRHRPHERALSPGRQRSIPGRSRRLHRRAHAGRQMDRRGDRDPICRERTVGARRRREVLRGRGRVVPKEGILQLHADDRAATTAPPRLVAPDRRHLPRLAGQVRRSQLLQTRHLHAAAAQRLDRVDG